MELPERKTLADKEMFDDIVQAILSVMGETAVKIILYGSVARGDNTWESDVDIAVLTDRKCDKMSELNEAIFPLDMKYDALISVVPLSTYEFFRAKYDIPFHVHIEGICELWYSPIL